MDTILNVAGPLFFGGAVGTLSLVAWLWRSGGLSDRQVAVIDAGLVPLIGLGTLLIAGADLAAFILVFGVSLPLAFFMYRLTVPLLERLLQVRRISSPASLNGWLADRPAWFRTATLVGLAIVFAAPSAFVLLLVLAAPQS